METKRNKKNILLVGLLSLVSCNFLHTSVDKNPLNENDWSFLILLQEKGDDSQNSIDIAEEFYLFTTSCIQDKSIKIQENEYGVFPISFDHPNGVELCCNEKLCTNSQYTIEDSYLGARDEVRKMENLEFGLSSNLKLKIYAIKGEFCICSADYAQVTFEGFKSYAYLTKSISNSRAPTDKEKKNFNKNIPQIKELLSIPQ